MFEDCAQRERVQIGTMGSVRSIPSNSPHNTSKHKCTRTKHSKQRNPQYAIQVRVARLGLNPQAMDQTPGGLQQRCRTRGASAALSSATHLNSAYHLYTFSHAHSRALTHTHAHSRTLMHSHTHQLISLHKGKQGKKNRRKNTPKRRKTNLNHPKSGSEDGRNKGKNNNV